ncbi:MAG: Cof-type HAD-IIB family hydrolase [Planctomycetaceae bacterium]|nr:Cof-type HAD-IIB family hydrolase [Planctomycetaceae bacterium]
MRIHLVALDIDGTLLNSAKQITATTAAIVRMARKQGGVHVVLASGRPPRSLMPIYRHLDLDSPTISYNGALVFDPPSNRILMHRPLALEMCWQVVEAARDEYPQVVISGEILDRWYSEPYDPALAVMAGKTFHPHEIGPVETWLVEPATKLLLLGEPGRLVELQKEIELRHPHQMTICTEGPLLQITHATVSKREALKMVAAEMGVMQSQVMAIGDNLNDVGMLEWAGVGVAMGNSPKTVLRVADYITDTHDADGAASAIHDIILGGLKKLGGEA